MDSVKIGDSRIWIGDVRCHRAIPESHKNVTKHYCKLSSIFSNSVILHFTESNGTYTILMVSKIRRSAHGHKFLQLVMPTTPGQAVKNLLFAHSSELVELTYAQAVLIAKKQISEFAKGVFG